jgi:hypothetical protein
LKDAVTKVKSRFLGISAINFLYRLAWIIIDNQKIRKIGAKIFAITIAFAIFYFGKKIKTKV